MAKQNGDKRGRHRKLPPSELEAKLGASVDSMLHSLDDNLAQEAFRSLDQSLTEELNPEVEFSDPPPSVEINDSLLDSILVSGPNEEVSVDKLARYLKSKLPKDEPSETISEFIPLEDDPDLAPANASVDDDELAIELSSEMEFELEGELEDEQDENLDYVIDQSSEDALISNGHQVPTAEESANSESDAAADALSSPDAEGAGFDDLSASTASALLHSDAEESQAEPETELPQVNEDDARSIEQMTEELSEGYLRELSARPAQATAEDPKAEEPIDPMTGELSAGYINETSLAESDTDEEPDSQLFDEYDFDLSGNRNEEDDDGDAPGAESQLGEESTLESLDDFTETAQSTTAESDTDSFEQMTEELSESYLREAAMGSHPAAENAELEGDEIAEQWADEFTESQLVEPSELPASSSHEAISNEILDDESSEFVTDDEIVAEEASLSGITVEEIDEASAESDTLAMAETDAADHYIDLDQRLTYKSAYAEVSDEEILDKLDSFDQRVETQNEAVVAAVEETLSGGDADVDVDLDESTGTLQDEYGDVASVDLDLEQLLNSARASDDTISSEAQWSVATTLASETATDLLDTGEQVNRAESESTPQSSPVDVDTETENTLESEGEAETRQEEASNEEPVAERDPAMFPFSEIAAEKSSEYPAPDVDSSNEATESESSATTETPEPEGETVQATETEPSLPTSQPIVDELPPIIYPDGWVEPTSKPADLQPESSNSTLLLRAGIAAGIFAMVASAGSFWYASSQSSEVASLQQSVEFLQAQQSRIAKQSSIQEQFEYRVEQELNNYRRSVEEMEQRLNSSLGATLKQSEDDLNTLSRRLDMLHSQVFSGDVSPRPGSLAIAPSDATLSRRNQALLAELQSRVDSLSSSVATLRFDGGKRSVATATTSSSPGSATPLERAVTPASVSPKPVVMPPAEPVAVDQPAVTPTQPSGSAGSGPWYVNFASTATESAADNELARLKAGGVMVQKVPFQKSGQTWYRLQVRGFATQAEAQKYANRMGPKVKVKSPWVAKAK